MGAQGGGTVLEDSSPTYKAVWGQGPDKTELLTEDPLAPLGPGGPYREQKSER